MATEAGAQIGISSALSREVQIVGIEDEFERIRRLSDLAEGPLEQFRKQQEILERVLQPDSSLQRMLQKLSDDSVSLKLAAQLEQMNRQSALLEQTQRMLASPVVIQQLEAARLQADRLSLSMTQYVLPDFSSLAGVALKLAEQVAPFEEMLRAQSVWAAKLEAQMMGMKVPWVDAEIASVSFEGFAVLSRLNHALRNRPPYDDAAREQIDEDLGEPIDVDADAGPDERDEAHVEAGMNASILAIAPSGMCDVLIQTGFVMKSEYAPLPPTTDDSDPGHLFHPGHCMLLTAVEQNLRRAVTDRMQSHFGQDWINTRVDPELKRQWENRRNEAVKHGESPLDLIQYANFMELKDIVVRRQHWREVFQPVFISKQHFETSMERLHPIRLPLAHSRPIGTAQQFHLIAEAASIMRALGIDIFAKA